ncbi:FAD-dependent oxidoreductase [Lacticaseibacillus zhaodongensis]|uniref:FAD-dependent oxidoreductase n=1 Tax=Lacticaseibacillus zhaodongensis TaxID=2668065 RepID=UPI0012D348EC|nr:FAD-dependent oxidoreductase [Lacticaseibacillus zhaodongensis]
MSRKYVIVGGVAGGMSAATRLRRLQEDAEIIVFEKGPHVSFANCGLPYYLGGEITDREALLVQTPAKLKARFNLDVRENSTVTAIDPTAKQVTVQSGDHTYSENYDALILSPGAKAIVPQLPGLKTADNVFTLRNIPDTDRIDSYLQTTGAQTAVVIGGGAIGLEAAENLRRRGLQVSLVEAGSHVFPALDEEMAAPLATSLRTHGVQVHLNDAVKEIGRQTVTLNSGQQLPADIILLAVGVKPNTDLTQSTGIKLGPTGGIAVDEHYQTSQKDIYAVGDAIEVTNQISEQPALIALASPANRQGRQVADVLSGVPTTNRGSIGTAIVRVFETVAATTGLSEAHAHKLGLHLKVAHISAKSHATYYPGAQPIWLKAIFAPDSGKIYGAAAVGTDGVDKRIDVLATAIKGGLTVFDLPELELTYAPPFGVAKDPVNMLGYVASNVARGTSQTIQWHELKAALAQGKQLLDVRDPDEYSQGHFAAAINMPLDQLREHLDELDPKQDYIVSCQTGLRSYIAERLLRGHGFHVQNLDGAIGLYQQVRSELLTTDRKEN